MFEGRTNDERFDSNDHLTAFLKSGTVLNVTVPGLPVTSEFTVLQEEQLINLKVPPFDENH